MADGSRPTTLFVGAFPPPESDIHGGMVTSCRALLAGGLAERLELILVDSTTRSVPPPPALVRLFYAIGRVARVIALIERRRPNAAIFFSGVGLSFLEKSTCAWYAERRGVRALLFMRGGPFIDRCRQSPRYRRMASQLLHAPSRVVCQGSTWRTFFSGEMGVPAERCVVIENWTAGGELLAIGAERALRPEHAGPVRILFVGWLDEKKGIFDLVDATAALVARVGRDRVRVTFCGDGRSRDEAVARARRLGVADVVEFLGWVEPGSLKGVLGAADIFVLPSYAEGFPNALVEAMATGLPAIVTPVGAVPDVVQDGVNGSLVSPGDVPALTAALERLVSSPAERLRLGQAAHETARERFSAETAVELITDVVHDATRTRRLKSAVVDQEECPTVG